MPALPIIHGAWSANFLTTKLCFVVGKTIGGFNSSNSTIVSLGALRCFFPLQNLSGSSQSILNLPGGMSASLSILTRIPCPEKTATVGLSAG